MIRCTKKYNYDTRSEGSVINNISDGKLQNPNTKKIPSKGTFHVIYTYTLIKQFTPRYSGFWYAHPIKTYS